MKKVVKQYIFLILIAAISLICVGPLFKSLNYGLDLQGGFEVLYKINSIDGSDLTSDMVTNTYKTLEKRVNTLGVSEPNITVEGNNIRVQLAGVKSSDDARKLLNNLLTVLDI